MKCSRCQTETDKFDLFPANVCLTCWAASAEGQRMPSALELKGMWRM